MSANYCLSMGGATMADPIETNLEIALKGMTSSDKEERAAVVPALLEVAITTEGGPK